MTFISIQHKTLMNCAPTTTKPAYPEHCRKHTLEHDICCACPWRSHQVQNITAVKCLADIQSLLHPCSNVSLRFFITSWFKVIVNCHAISTIFSGQLEMQGEKDHICLKLLCTFVPGRKGSCQHHSYPLPSAYNSSRPLKTRNCFP